MKKTVIMIIMIILLISLCGCNGKNNNDNELKTKVSEELQYLDKNLIYLLNKLNNISFENYSVSSEKVTLGETSESTVEETGEGGSGDSNSQSGSSGGSTAQGDSSSTGDSTSSNGGGAQSSKSKSIATTEMKPNTILTKSQEQIDWNSIKLEIEIINSAWSVIILDLYNSNVDKTEILNFSNNLDNTIISIKNESKGETLNNLAKLYSYITKFSNMISLESSKQNLQKTKEYLVNAYSIVESSNWDEILVNINEAIKAYKNVVNDIEYSRNKEYKINKIYILLEELKNSLETQDKEIFYINYKNIMETINSL